MINDISLYTYINNNKTRDKFLLYEPPCTLTVTCQGTWYFNQNYLSPLFSAYVRVHGCYAGADTEFQKGGGGPGNC